jgi:hypothetical protein
MALAQYDLLLTQNVSAAGTEWSEKLVHLNKGDILTADTNHVPVVLPAGTDTYILSAHADHANGTGLEWIAQAAGHTQHTDTGTTSNTFTLDSDSTTGKMILDVANGAADKSITITNQALTDDIIITLPNVTGTLATEAYASGLFAANDAMVYKGTVGTGGTIEKAALEALTTYNAGWTYRVITAGTYFSVVCQVGDLITAIVDRAGSGDVDTDWTVVQTNIDGAVVGPASVTDGYLTLFDGVTGKLIKAGTGAPGTMAYETATNYMAKSVLTEQGDILYASAASTPAALAHGNAGQVLQSGGHAANPSWLTLGTMAAATATDYVTKALYDANSILYATSDNTPLALTVGASTVVGRKASGDIVALTPAEIVGVVKVGVPAAYNADGTENQVSFDGNYGYRCTTSGSGGTGRWIRWAVATNW